MVINNIHLVYFSPAFSTKKVAQHIAQEFNLPIVKHDITLKPVELVQATEADLVIVAVPVYAGRVPQLAAERIKQLKGNKTPAIAICVYGNRDYDDALLELKDLLDANGCITVGAAAVIAMHSIFPEVAKGRPDSNDLIGMSAFVQKCKGKIQTEAYLSPDYSLPVKGNKPYKVPKSVPLSPKTSSACTECGACAEQCPTGAIDIHTPSKTDKAKCIACTRCIAICPQHARNFKGLIYKLAKKQFTKTYAKPKENEVFV